MMGIRILAVGEVLWDLLPSGKQLGGAPANFTYHCRSLGADAGLVTRIGHDDLGREVLERFRTLDLPTEPVQIDPDAPTGTVAVELASDGQPRYIIHEHVAWDFLAADDTALALAATTDAVCFGSLAQRDATSRHAIRAIVAATRPATLRIFDVNLRPPFLDRDVIADSLRLANALKLNDEELPKLALLFDMKGNERDVMTALAKRFDLSLVALTRGAGGSLLMADGVWSDDPGRPVTVSDTIGAGDSFTAALVVGRLLRRNLDEINRRANEVAAFVCSQPGGTPTLPEALKYPTEATPKDHS